MQKVFVFLILVLAIVTRLGFINIFPPSLNWDETSIGYNAYSILKTGRDEWDFPMPIVFRAFGDFKLPLYIYSTVPSLAVFGLNNFSVRLPSVISGLGLIITTYLISRKYFSRDVSLVSMFLVAISPWDLWLSRIAVEANLGIFLLSVGICLLTYKRNFMGILFLGLAAFAYNSVRIVAPMFLLIWILGNFRKIKFGIFHYVLILVLFLPVGIQLLKTTGQVRIQQIGIIDSGAIGKIEALRNASLSPFARYVYNRPVYFVTEFAKNYIGHFLPDFLFIKGGSHYQFSIPNTGLLYIVCLPAFYLGLTLVLKDYRKYGWLIVWLLLAPIPGSLTRDSPHTLRAVTMLPIPMIFSGLGLMWLARKIKYRTTLLIFIALSIVGFGYYAKSFYEYQNNYSWAWQYGYKQAINYVNQNMDEYDQIIFTKKYAEPHEFVLWYTPYSPALHQKQLSTGEVNWNYHDNWYWTDGFDKYVFVNDWEMSDFVSKLSGSGKYLIVASPDNPLVGKYLTQIDFLDGRPAFVISSVGL